MADEEGRLPLPVCDDADQWHQCGESAFSDLSQTQSIDPRRQFGMIPA